VIRKTRHSVPSLGVDVFGPPLDGLVLAEVELDTEQELSAFESPAGALAEVTDDERFSGGRLACTTKEQLMTLLHEFGRP
jgi:CYTH domain-containing protein